VQEKFDEDKSSAKLSELEGNVTYQQKNAQDWSEAEINLHLFPQERIKTGNNSFARLIFADASRTTMISDTELVIKSIEPTQETEGLIDIVVKVIVGLTLFEVKDKEGVKRKFMVESPSAITCVRGTIFSVAVYDNKTTRVVVKKGQVDVTGLGATVTVMPSYATTVRPDATPSTPELVNLIEERIFDVGVNELPTLKRRE